MTEPEALALAAAALPCPFCGERLVAKQDHHGWWVAHVSEPGPCFDSVAQLHGPEQLAQWNTRTAPPPTAERPKPAVYVFGCFNGRYGHFMQSGGVPYPIERAADWSPDLRRGPGPQPEGQSWLRRADGWTFFGWYDRRGDERKGSHTTLVAQGTGWTAAEMFAAAPAWAVRVLVDVAGVEVVP